MKMKQSLAGLIAIAITAGSSLAAGIPFGSTGTGIQTFTTLPPADQWATASVGVNNGTYTTAAQLDAAVKALAASSIASTLVSSSASLPSANKKAVWSSAGSKFVQTCPTSIGATLLKATLVNQTGGSLSAIRLTYKQTVSTYVAEEVPGHRVFYSLTGAANSWIAIPALTGVTTSSNFDITVTLASAWNNGANLYLLWADDNDKNHSPDTYFKFDDFAASPAGSVPLSVTLTAPTNGQTFASGATVAMQAVTSGVTSASVTNMQFRADGATVGNDATSPYAYSWSGATAGSHALAAVAQLNNGTAVTSATVSITVAAPANQPPSVAIIAPTNNARDVALSPTLTVAVSDPENSNLSVAFYGRPAASAVGSDFTLVALPDTQYYASSYPQIFRSQTDWIVSNRLVRNIAYVAHEGDMADTASSQAQYQNVTNALYRLENPATTGLPDGIPYGPCVGNHDQPTTLYNTYFGASRYAGRSYYGGHYGSNNDSHYDLFNAGGMDFVVLYITMAGGGDSSLMAWGNNVLQTYANRRAIVVSHSLLNVTTRPTPSTWTAEGSPIFNALKGNTNLFLMLCGHMHGEGFRHEVLPDGRVIDVILADYQSEANGGNGNLRLMTFSPSNNVIHVTTYSPYTGSSRTGANSQFDLSYNMSGTTAPFAPVGTNVSVTSGTQTSMIWPGLTANTIYQWYAVASDGVNNTASTAPVFTTRP
jgi:hypothetical protein